MSLRRIDRFADIDHSVYMPGKNQFLQIRVSELEKSTIQQAAQRANMDMSTWALNKLLPHKSTQYQEIVQSVINEPQNRRYLFAELNDLITQADKDDIMRIMEYAPPAELDTYTNNYIAAMVETATHKLDMAVTGWPLKVTPLQLPVFASDLTSLRLHLLTHSPPAFRRRNIFIDASIGDRV